MKQEFVLEDYNPNWIALYESEKEELLKIFGDNLNSIHHIGSTAIPGAMAKPEIDIFLVVKDDSAISSYDKKIERLGYNVRGECVHTGGTAGRFYYSKDINNKRTYKLHICQVGHPEILSKLLFVQYLNEHLDVTYAYSTLKIKLSKKYNYGRNIEKYLEGKTSFIQEVLNKAKSEYIGIQYEDFI